MTLDVVRTWRDGPYQVECVNVISDELRAGDVEGVEGFVDPGHNYLGIKESVADGGEDVPGAWGSFELFGQRLQSTNVEDFKLVLADTVSAT